MSTFKTGKLIVVTLWAPDIIETVHFYRDVLGLDLLPHNEKQPIFSVGEGVHMMIRKGTPLPAEDATPFPVAAFQVLNLDEAIEHLQAQGVKMAGEIVTNPSARYIMFRDPAGNLLEIAELFAGVH
jgi:catechol 2,3-dioxygenase-like lactoylglutathione lyase family enzyme